MKNAVRWRWRLTLIAAVSVLAGCSAGQTLPKFGLTESRLAPCPASPNCVSSQANGEQRIEALGYKGDAIQARDRLLSVLKAMQRSSVQHVDAGYIHAEFRSALFGFVDDVEFHFDPPGSIQLRSASRVGYSDLGVNRKRVEEIRTRFATTPGSAT